jgi:uncharacterized membrane protein required for colicin V production
MEAGSVGVGFIISGVSVEVGLAWIDGIVFVVLVASFVVGWIGAVVNIVGEGSLCVSVWAGPSLLPRQPESTKSRIGRNQI